MSERLAALIAEWTPVAGHRPWPRYEIDDEAWITIAQDAGEGRRRSAGLCGATRTRSHLAHARRRRSRALRRVAADDDLGLSVGRPLPSAGHPARARDARSLWLSAVQRARPPPVARSRCLGRCARRLARGRRRCGAIRPTTISFPSPGRGCTRSRSARCMPASSSPGISASPSTARSWRGWKSGSAMCTRASTGCSSMPIWNARRRSSRASPATPPWPTVLPSLARSRRRSISIRRAASAARRHGGARAHRQSSRRYRRDLQRRLVLLDPCPLRHFARARAGGCDRVFGHRLMMDRIVPGGVTHDVDRAPAPHCHRHARRGRAAVRRDRAAL